MIRRAAALAFALVLSPAMLDAQDVVFTISVPSADVYKGPSNVTPIVGHAARGTAMPVLRNLGSWVRVPWPDAPDGVAYVHVTMGRLASPAGNGAAPMPQRSSASSPTPASSSAAAQVPAAPRPGTPPRERVVVAGQQDSTPISHVWGVGGAVGSMRSIGATARAWRANRLGLQIALTRDEMTSEVVADRVTSMQIEPAIVYGLVDSVSDYFWIRPYVGSGVSFRHQTLHPPAAGTTATDNGVGFRFFGGAELTFAGAPRLALSVDAGYRRLPTPFAGFTPNHAAVSISGHWYIN
jgi:hypothetical protein